MVGGSLKALTAGTATERGLTTEVGSAPWSCAGSGWTAYSVVRIELSKRANVMVISQPRWLE